MIHQLHVKSGDVFGIKYTFQYRGEGIPMHRHDVTHAHNVTVLLGSIVLYGSEGSNPIKATAGDVIEFDWSQPHEIAALEPNTVIFNQFLNGQPEGYDRLPPEELEWKRECWPLTMDLVDK
jgi:quercetin dioxygenase-like cupin family protein